MDINRVSSWSWRSLSFCQVISACVLGEFGSTCSDVDLGLGFVIIMGTVRAPKTSDFFGVGCQRLALRVRDRVGVGARILALP